MRSSSIGFTGLMIIGLMAATSGCGAGSDAWEDEGRGSPPERRTVNWGKADGTGCTGICGKKAPAGCWCDAKCTVYNDCCADKAQVCDGKKPSCQGFCGKKSTDGCWCDSLCTQYGDCCPDKAPVCDGPGDPCKGISCATPPPALCADANTARSFAPVGQCSAGKCSYASTDTACPFGCKDGACLKDPCANITCNTPPAASCVDGKTLRSYAPVGTCQSGQCSYASTDTVCNDGCSAGACQAFSCSWGTVFASLYGQAWNPGDVAFATSDGALTRGLSNLDIAAMKNTASPSSIRVKGNPNPVVEVRLLGSTVYKVLATRNGKYLVGLGHAMWAEAALGATGQTEQTLLRQFSMEEPSQPQVVAYLRLLIDKMEGAVPQADRANWRAAADALLYKFEAGQLAATIGEPHNHYKQQGGNKTFEFQLSLSFGRDAELGTWTVPQTWSWLWQGWSPAPRCNGCASSAFAGKNFLQCNNTLSWADAQKACQARGGGLATLENATQAALLRSLYVSGAPWIGLNDQAVEGTYVWQSGKPVSYITWASGQPDNYQGKEDCVHIWESANKPTWNDLDCASAEPYVCELP